MIFSFLLKNTFSNDENNDHSNAKSKFKAFPHFKWQIWGIDQNEGHDKVNFFCGCCKVF